MLSIEFVVGGAGRGAVVVGLGASLDHALLNDPEAFLHSPKSQQSDPYLFKQGRIWLVCEVKETNKKRETRSWRS